MVALVSKVVGAMSLEQKKVVALGAEVFGEPNMKSRDERMIRFMEEAAELVQAGGMTREMAHRMIDYSYGRPKETEMHKEVGGVQITLFALADSFGIDVETAYKTEFNRVKDKAAECRIKHQGKPKSVKAV